MTRRFLLILFFALLPCVSSAQFVERIKADPAWLWAEGFADSPAASDDAALSALVMKLAATDLLQIPSSSRLRIWQTYLSDIRDKSVMTITPGGVFRYIAWQDIPSVFDARWRKVRELARSAEQSVRHGDMEVARTYCTWAEVYLTSLPEGEGTLRGEVVALRTKLGDGPEAPLQIRNVESEVAAIRRAWTVGSVKPFFSPPAPTPPPAPEPDSRREPLEPLEIPSSPISFAQRTNLPLLFVPEPSETPEYVISESEARPLEWSFSALTDLGRIPAYGALVAVSGARLGAYLSCRSNFVQGRSDYACTLDGKTEWGYIWTSGKVRSSRTVVNCGMSFCPWDRVGFLGGVGYGREAVLWEDSAGRWASVSDISHAGLSVELGVQFRAGHLVITGGCSSIRFRDLSALLGLGWRF